VEFEIEKILEHSNKLYNYINTNLQPLYDDLEFSIFRVKQMKQQKDIIKSKFLINSAQNIRHGIKKKNLSLMISTAKSIKSLKEILDLLKVLSTNPAKYQVTQDLINKGKEIMNQIQKISSNKSKINTLNNKKSSSNNTLKILKYFEEEFNKYSNKSSEKIIQEFNNILYEEINKLISIDEELILNSESTIDYSYYVKISIYITLSNSLRLTTSILILIKV
jgi:hypothetical protein